MINTTTLVQHYIDFCELGSVPVKPTPDGFIKLVTNGYFFTLFVSAVVFVTIVVASYQGNIVPRGVFHLCATTLIVGIFTGLNSRYLGK